MLEEFLLNELVQDVLGTAIVAIIGYLGKQVKDYLDKKKSILGYEFDNSRVERIIDNAVIYAEGVALDAIKSKIKPNGRQKLNTAKKYIKETDKTILANPNLEMMIARAVTKNFNIKK